MLLIYNAETTEAPSQQEIDQIMGEYWAYDEGRRRRRGEGGRRCVAGRRDRHHGANPARRARGGRWPFAETREVLGGYYLLDVPDLDAALDWAARCPGSKYGSVEVRPIMVFDAP